MAGADLTTQQGSHADHGAHVEHASHPTVRFYVVIFVILFVVTVLEVLVAQEPLLGIITGIGIPVIIPLLLLGAAKFLMIAAFYMHLKQDSRVFTAFLTVGLILAMGMLFTFMGLFAAHSREPFDEVAWRQERAAQSGANGKAGGAGGATGPSGTGASAGTSGTAGTGATGSAGR